MCMRFETNATNGVDCSVERSGLNDSAATPPIYARLRTPYGRSISIRRRDLWGMLAIVPNRWIPIDFHQDSRQLLRQGFAVVGRNIAARDPRLAPLERPEDGSEGSLDSVDVIGIRKKTCVRGC